jgi:putative sugar O-methyltransferase
MQGRAGQENANMHDGTADRTELRGAIIAKARSLRKTVQATLKAPDAVRMSYLWQSAHHDMHNKAIASIDDEHDLIAFLTENNAFTYPRLVDDPQCAPIADAYLVYLEKAGTPLRGMPDTIAESDLVGKRAVFQREGRAVSTMFLLHLCAALRIRDHTSDVQTVLEIGGGYGNLARVLRLFYPKQRYVIVDLLNSLYCSYVFLASHFPGLRLLFVTSESEIRSLNDYDFAFVPTEFFAGLRGRAFDLVVNTCSLGEMPQSTVDTYMHFLNQEAKVRFFYSINRFGHFDPNVVPDQANVSVKLDPDWRIRVWDAFGEQGFAQIEPAAPRYLELLAERIPTSATKELHRMLAGQLYALAKATPPRSSAWHYLMWNSIRIAPAADVIWDYLRVIEADGFRDAPYYRDLYARSERTAMPLPTGIAMAATTPETEDTPALRAARARLAEVYASRSWRWTKPFRWLLSHI